MIKNKELTRKERERLFRRNEILDAAVKLFAEKGFDHTTLDEIAEASEFGKGTLYNYFQNKEEIYTAILENIFSDYFKIIQESESETENFIDFIRKLTKSLFEYCANNQYAFLVLAKARNPINGNDPLKKSKIIEDQNKRISDFYDQKIENAIKSGLIKKLDVNSVKNLYRSFIFPYIYSLLFCSETKSFDSEKESEFIITVLLEGILRKS